MILRKGNTELTPAEKKRLNQKIIGYGNLTRAAEASGVSKNTIRLIAYRGYGETPGVQKLRATILNTKVAAELEHSNT